MVFKQHGCCFCLLWFSSWSVPRLLMFEPAPGELVFQGSVQGAAQLLALNGWTRTAERSVLEYCWRLVESWRKVGEQTSKPSEETADFWDGSEIQEISRNMRSILELVWKECIMNYDKRIICIDHSNSALHKSLLRFLGFNIFQQRSPSCLAEVQVAPTCNGEAMIQVMKWEKLLDMLDGQKLSTRSASTLVISSVMSEDDVSWWGIRLMNVDECRWVVASSSCMSSRSVFDSFRDVAQAIHCQKHVYEPWSNPCKKERRQLAATV